MAGDPEGEGLARPGPPDDHGDALATLAQVPDHRRLVLAGGGMGGQAIAHGLVGSHGGVLARPASGRGNQRRLEER
jgi:hypothetical protein